MSIRAKISIAWFGSGVLVLAIFSLFLYGTVAERAYSVARATLIEHAEHELRHMNESGKAGHVEPSTHGHEVFIRIESEGRLIFDSFPADLPVAAASLLDERHGITFRDRRRLGDRDYDVLAYYDLVPTREYLAMLIHELATGCLIAAIGLLPITWVFTGWVLRPFRQFADAAEAIEADRLDVRLPRTSPNDEYGRLVDVFNRLLDRLERSFGGLKIFAANASHEMKTPLAAIVAQGELFLRRVRRTPDTKPDLEPVERMLAQARRLGGVTSQLLALSSIEVTSHETEDEEVGLREVFDSLRDRLGGDESKPRLVWDPRAADVLIRARPALVDTALTNFVSNALRYANSEVRVGAFRGEGRTFLIVDDDGPGIPYHRRVEAMTPFVRAVDGDTKKSGSGLGLAIARACVRASGGSVWLAASPQRGLRVVAEFPNAVGELTPENVEKSVPPTAETTGGTASLGSRT